MRVSLVYCNQDKVTARGPGYVAAAVMASGHSLTFYDTAYVSSDEVIRDVVTIRPETLLISASTLFIQEASKLALGVKRSNPDIPVILGGMHATLVPHEILTNNPEFDYLCVGEGEAFTQELLRRIESSEDVSDLPGLGYRDPDGQIRVNEVGPPADLNSLPEFPYWIFDPKSVVIDDGPKPGFSYVAATRGCPYRCTYCCNEAYLDLYPKKYLRKTNPQLVVKDLLLIKDNYPVKMFFFGDEMVLFDVPYCEELFARIHKDVGLPYGCMARVERINDRVVQLLKNTGCRYVGMGIECGDEEFRLKFLNRRMTNDQIVDAFKRLRGIPNIMLASYNIKGFPVPNDQQLTKATRELNNLIQPNIVQVSTFYPFPGTKLHRYCVENDLIDPIKLKTVVDVFSTSVLKDNIQ